MTQLAFLSTKDFLSVMSKYQEDFEKFSQIKDEINIYNKN